MAIGAAGALTAAAAAKQAYKAWKKRKEESLVDGFDEIREIALQEHGVEFYDNEVLFYALLDSIDEEPDAELEEDIYLFGESLEEDPFDPLDEASKKKKAAGSDAAETFIYGRPPRPSGATAPDHGFVGAAGQAAGIVAGTALAKTLLKRKKRAKLLKDVKKTGKDVGKALKTPYGKGAAAAIGALGAAKLAKKALQRRKEAKKGNE